MDRQSPEPIDSLSDYDVTIVMSVTDAHWKHAESNVEIGSRINPGADIRWILIANNHDPEYEIPPSILQNDNVLLLDGFEYSRFKDKHRPSSTSLATAIHKGLKYSRSRYVAQLDADFFVIQSHWVKESISYMSENGLAVWGSPWHLKRYHKWRHFPCSHFTLIDTHIVPLDNVDLMPDYGEYFEFSSLPTACRTWLHLSYLKREVITVENLISLMKKDLLEIKEKKTQFVTEIQNPEAKNVASMLLPLSASEGLNREQNEKLSNSHGELKNLRKMNIVARKYSSYINHVNKVQMRGPFSDVHGLVRREDHVTWLLQIRIKHRDEVRRAVLDLEGLLSKGGWRASFTRPLERATDRLPDTVKKVFNHAYLWFVQCVEIGSTGDCNVRLYRYCRSLRIRADTVQISVGKENYGWRGRDSLTKRLVFWVLLYLEQLLPIQYNRRPLWVRSVTRKRFSDYRMPDFRRAGWEEYLWREKPFAVHIRSTSRLAEQVPTAIQERRLYQYLDTIDPA